MKAFLKKIVVAILTLEARFVLAKYAPRIIGITGSVGKTTTKDVIYTALSSQVFVRKSQKSFNSEIGVPLAILGLDTAWGSAFGWFTNLIRGLGVGILPNHYPRWLVLELGVDHPGDISRVVRWLPLDAAVVTRIGKVPVHVEFFDSPETLVREKRAIMDGLVSEGTLILNRDDDTVWSFKETSRHRTLSFSTQDEQADVVASHYTVRYEDGVPVGIAFKVSLQGNVVPIRLSGVVGRQFIPPVLAGLAVAVAQGMNVVTAARAIEEHVFAPGRMRLLAGIKQSVLLDDSYNSSPVALEAALAVLDEMLVPKKGRKVCVLGDMMELGRYSPDAHRAAGEQAGSVCDVVITVGVRAHASAEAARRSGVPKEHVHSFDNSHVAADTIVSLIQENDLVLIKGSQSPRLERVTEALLAEPHRARELLVRQDSVWEHR